MQTGFSLNLSLKMEIAGKPLKVLSRLSACFFIKAAVLFSCISEANPSPNSPEEKSLEVKPLLNTLYIKLTEPIFPGRSMVKTKDRYRKQDLLLCG